MVRKHAGIHGDRRKTHSASLWSLCDYCRNVLLYVLHVQMALTGGQGDTSTMAVKLHDVIRVGDDYQVTSTTCVRRALAEVKRADASGILGIFGMLSTTCRALVGVPHLESLHIVSPVIVR